MKDGRSGGDLALAILCWVLGLAAVGGPALAILDEQLGPPGGMFRNLQSALALLILLPALTAFSFAANLVYARRRRWSSRWLKGVLLVQGLILLAAALAWGKVGLDSYLEARHDARRHAVQQAIAEDAPDSIEATLQRYCADACEGDDLDRFLIAATEESAYRAMDYLLARGASPTPHYRISRSYRSCEGLYLPSLSSLELSVLQGDPVALELLLPAAEERGLRKAAWLAARFDRLELLKRLLAAGVPLFLRGAILDENATLLNAAASGAALVVGRWLLEVQGFAPDGDPGGSDRYRGETPLVSLVRFASEVPASPRFTPFLEMLLAEGADIEKRSGPDERTALQMAVDQWTLPAVERLLEAGASPRSLTPEDRARLRQLRARPPYDNSLHADAPGCLP